MNLSLFFFSQFLYIYILVFFIVWVRMLWNTVSSLGYVCSRRQRYFQFSNVEEYLAIIFEY